MMSSYVRGDTSSAPVGGGAWASRGMTIGGEAALQAACALRQHILEVAASFFKVATEQVDLRGGVLSDASGTHSMTLREFAALAHFRQHELPGGLTPQLAVTRQYVPNNFPYAAANGIQCCYLEVDAETGPDHFARPLGRRRLRSGDQSAARR